MSEKKAEKLKIDPKTLLIDVLYDIIGSVLYGAGMYTFAVSSNFAPGGVSGLAILVNYITGGKIPLVLILPQVFELTGLQMTQSVADVLTAAFTAIFTVKTLRSLDKLIEENQNKGEVI